MILFLFARQINFGSVQYSRKVTIYTYTLYVFKLFNKQNKKNNKGPLLFFINIVFFFFLTMLFMEPQNLSPSLYIYI